jgi:hypothetical protein
VTALSNPRGSDPWLVSRRFDLAIFGGSAALSVILLVAGFRMGLLDGETPAWLWVAGVLFVDVAHVWSTGWRVIWNHEERALWATPLMIVPAVAYVVLVVCHALSSRLFWMLLAYTAVFHFIRQQRGFVALYARKAGSASRTEVLLDAAAVYAGTLWPVLHWHANLPRRFSWLIDGDFLTGATPILAQATFPLYVGIGLAYVAKEMRALRRRRAWSAGKNLVVASTWLTWGLGLVAFNSDYAFTVTNVFVHGIPYLGLIWAYGRHRTRDASAASRFPFSLAGVPVFLGVVAGFAWIEEWGWDRFVWHEQPGIFPGPSIHVSQEALSLLVPLLALPQATHYILDGFIWRGSSANRSVGEFLGLPARAS